MSAVLGAQRPRILHVPDFVASTGGEAAELAAMGGLDLDEWQRYVLECALGEREDGSWSAFEVGVEVPRQNGKGGLLEARELAGLFLLKEQLIIHSAHEFSTAEEALERMAVLIESCDYFSRRVRTIKRSHGQEGVYLTNGQRLRYRTRTKGGGRGLSADLIVLDEAMHIPDAMLNALLPTLSARENPQLWYTGSAVDQQTMNDGLVFSRLRARGVKGEDERLAYFGWSPAFDSPDDVTPEAAADPAVWGQGNPALGIRITEEYIAGEQRSMSPRGFAVERLGVGDWPDVDGSTSRIIAKDAWDALADPGSEIAGARCFAFDVQPDRSSASVAVSGRRADGLFHVEVLEHGRGTGWLASCIEDLLSEHENVGVMCDPSGPAGALIPDFADLAIEPDLAGAREHAQACGLFFDAVGDGDLRHLGSHELDAALAGAATRSLGDAWAWARKSSTVDISPLVACTLALWGSRTIEASSTVGIEVWA